MNLYADEGVDRQIVEAPRAAGFDVAYAVETDPAAADDEVLGKAAAEGRLLLTSDKDFGELVYRLGKASEGVMLIRLAGLSAPLKARLVVEAVSGRATRLRNSETVSSTATSPPHNIAGRRGRHSIRCPLDSQILIHA